jgi:hypothetical protein
MDIILHSNFDPALVNVEDMGKAPHSATGPRIKFVNVSYGPERRKLRIQMPSMRVPFESKLDGAPSVVTAFGSSPAEIAIFDKLRALDERLVRIGVERSEEFFGAQKTPDVVREKYNATVRDKPPFAPVIQSKCYIHADGAVRTPIFDRAGTRQGFEELRKGALITNVISIPCVYISGSGFGFSRKAEKVRVDVPAYEADAFSFIPDTSDAMEEDEQHPSAFLD